jgi:hypothetical protein
MTSSNPQSALVAERPPSVVIKSIGQPTPVVFINLVSDLAALRSRLASINKTSTSGISTRQDFYAVLQKA